MVFFHKCSRLNRHSAFHSKNVCIDFGLLNLFPDCANPADIAFVVDSSGSVEVEQFGNVIRFIKDLVNQMDIQSGLVRAGIVVYSDNAFVQSRLSTSGELEDLLFAADTLSYFGGETNTAGAIRVMRRDLFNTLEDRLTVQNYAVIVTDGIPNVEPNNTVLEAIRSRIEGTYIILVTVGQGMNTGRNYIALSGIPSEPVSENFFNVRSFSDLYKIVPDVAAAMCNGK